MRRKEFKIGTIVKNLKIIKLIGAKFHNNCYTNYYLCECLVDGPECKKFREVSAHSLGKSNRVIGCGSTTCSKKFHNLINKRFGKLVAIKFAGMIEVRSRIGLGEQAHWECLCDCGNTYIVPADLLLVDKVKSCGCLKPNYIIGQLTGYHFSRVRNKAKKRKIEFDLTMEEAWNKFEQQDGKCIFTGKLLTITTRHKNGNASLDRIDSNKGYIKNNIQWVDKRVNLMKHNLTDKKFIEICKLIAEYNKEK